MVTVFATLALIACVAAIGAMYVLWRKLGGEYLFGLGYRRELTIGCNDLYERVP